MTNSSIIKFTNFSFSYDGKNKILKNITLKVNKGERILILGPSGCGKSTLILCLNGIIPQLIKGSVEGTILVKDMSSLDTPISSLSQHIGVVFQDPESQFCMLTVKDEIAFGLENLMIARENMEGKIKSSLEKVGLLPYYRWMLNRLSGGMKQRVSLASLLAMDQEILIFDEPTSNLDPKGTREVSEIITKLPKDKTLIVIEHKLDEFIDIFDKVLLMDRKGRVVAFEHTKEFFLNHQQQVKKMGVWIPQISKYIYKLYKNGIKLDNFPLNKEGVKKAFEKNTGIRKRSFAVLKQEIGKNICKPTGNYTGFCKPNQCIIKVENLRYKFRQSCKYVLENINFTVNKGDFLGIIGNNGSGKTTLAKLVINLYPVKPPSKITIYNPHSPEHRAAKKDEILKLVGFIFQNPEHQFIEDSAYKEIAYGLKIRGCDDLSINEKTDEILKIMGLEKLRDANPFNLSQGQKRKLSVASILVVDHEIIILDEPTFGLDYITTTNLMNLLVKLNKKGKTIIIITHDMNIIFKYTRNLLVLKNGNSVFLGSTHKLLSEKEIIESSGLNVPPLYKLYSEVSSYAVL